MLRSMCRIPRLKPDPCALLWRVAVALSLRKPSARLRMRFSPGPANCALPTAACKRGRQVQAEAHVRQRAEATDRAAADQMRVLLGKGLPLEACHLAKFSASIDPSIHVFIHVSAEIRGCPGEVFGEV